MSTLLKIHSSLTGPQGQSSQLVERLAQQWQTRNPDGRILTRDLAAEPVPHLTAERFQAFLSDPQTRTPEQQAIVDYSDALVAELRSADVIVLGVPMYNFSIPSTLRAYFDHIARAGVTFRYTDQGSEGLITGKKAYVAITRGGYYDAATDTQTPYVRNFLAFLGIVDVEFIHAEGLAIGEQARERSLTAAHHKIAQLLPATLAA